MGRSHPIKVIKRVEREQSEQEATGGTRSPEKTSELAAAVKEWISESRQTRLLRHEELKQQLGW